MKAAIDLDFKNFKAFSKGMYDNKANLDSYFTVKKGEIISEKLKVFGYSEKQIKDSEMNFLKGSPERVILENSEDANKQKEAQKEKESYEGRFEELKVLNRDKQKEMLKELKAKSIPRLEGDRIRLIMELEK